jgi:hypothetical protein
MTVVWFIEQSLVEFVLPADVQVRNATAKRKKETRKNQYIRLNIILGFDQGARD